MTTAETTTLPANPDLPPAPPRLTLRRRAAAQSTEAPPTPSMPSEEMPGEAAVQATPPDPVPSTPSAEQDAAPKKRRGRPPKNTPKFEFTAVVHAPPVDLGGVVVCAEGPDVVLEQETEDHQLVTMSAQVFDALLEWGAAYRAAQKKLK